MLCGVQIEDIPSCWMSESLINGLQAEWRRLGQNGKGLFFCLGEPKFYQPFFSQFGEPKSKGLNRAQEMATKMFGLSNLAQNATFSTCEKWMSITGLGDSSLAAKMSG